MGVKPLTSTPPKPVSQNASILRRWGPLLLLALLAGGCFIGTINRLWQTRRQMLRYEEYIRYEPSTAERGPGLTFLDPKLTREDILSLASDRVPSTIDSLDGREHWVFTWHRRPMMRGKSINLHLLFMDDRMEMLYIDRRFAEALGEDRIEMLARNFVGRKTDLDLSGRRIVCSVPAEELAPFSPLMLEDLHKIFGKENRRRSGDNIPEDEVKLIFRYRLKGAKGDKAAMSFGATIKMDSGLLGRITSRIGSFQLEFDLSQQPLVSESSNSGVIQVGSE